MYVVKSNEEMASDFITGTCQLVPKSLSSPSDHMHDLAMSKDPLRKRYSILCGSLAEFYIRPLNTCIADTDFLYCRNDELAFSGDFPMLRGDISGLADTIDCYEIESHYAFPGFVRLRVLGEMKYNWKHREYRLIRNTNPGVYENRDRTYLLSSYMEIYNSLGDERPKTRVTCGPAIKTLFSSVSGIESDVVHCFFCPQWPRDAQTWPIRPRQNGWPNSHTISEVVRNGCHIVYVQHRACRDDELQWRLSFSIAEVILLHSWTKTQQIVYHLLRFFAKRELIKKDCSKEDEVLCTYHLKTLMLWTCEEMPSKWWDSSPVIALCCELLSVLLDWLKRRHYPNYFIPEANLFHQPSTSTLLHQTEIRLNDFRKYGILSRWFVENYILPITQTNFLSMNIRDVTEDLMGYMRILIEYRNVAMPLFVEFMVANKFIHYINTYRRSLRLGISGIHVHLKEQQIYDNFQLERCTEMPYVPVTDKVLCVEYYDVLLQSLQFAFALSNGETSWDCSLLAEFVNAISLQPKIIRSQFHNFPKPYTAEDSRYQSMQAQGLMENLTGLNSRSEFQLVSLLSKEFLRRTLEADGYESNGVTTAAFVYLAALHFASSEYLQAMRLCLAVLVDHTPEEEEESLNAGCLLFLDDIARIVGLCVLHTKINYNNLHYVDRRLYLDLRLSPKVFAQYLSVLSSERFSTHLSYCRDLLESTFPMDNYVKDLIKPRLPTIPTAMRSRTQRNDAKQMLFRRIYSLTEGEATSTNALIAKNTVVNLLMEIALENMMSFYSVFLKDFGIQCNIVDCYRALYFYKCLNYDEVLQLCERISNEPDLQNDFKTCVVSNVSMIPPLDSFFDSAVQSLLGFHTLFYYLSPLNEDLYKIDETDDTTFELWFAKYVKFPRDGDIERDGLAHCLLRRYSIKYNYFIGRHFLARYLKVRCCIECNLPYKEAMTEFIAQKINFPFELLIRRFLLRRHRIIQQHGIAVK